MALRFFLLSFIFILVIGCNKELQLIMKHRRDYRKSFLLDERAPIQKKDLKHLEFFPPSTQHIVNAKVDLTPEAEIFDLPTYSGITRSYRKYADLSFRWEGDMVLRLSVYENQTLKSNPVYADYLFLPFKDETNGKTTYGGGRYMNISKKDLEDGEILLDFNTCYNPWCAYSDGFNCPIPPKENILAVSIEAGEKLYTGEHKAAVE